MRQAWRDRARARREGFTLIELLVVMTIIAIGFFAVRPGITGVLRGAENRRAMREVVGLFRGARTEAIATGRLVRVMCDPEAGLFWAEAQVDPAVDRRDFELLRVLGRERVQLPDALYLSELVVSGQSVRGVSQDPIYFYPDGRTDGAELLLLDANGRELVVQIAPATGKVSVSV